MRGGAAEFADTDDAGQGLGRAGEQVGRHPPGVEGQLCQLRLRIDGGQVCVRLLGAGEEVPEPSGHRTGRAGDGQDPQPEVPPVEGLDGGGVHLSGQFEMGRRMVWLLAGCGFQLLDHCARQGHRAPALGGGGAGQLQQQSVAPGHRPGRFAHGDEPFWKAHAPVGVRGHLHRNGDVLAVALGELLDPPTPGRCPVRMSGQAGQHGRCRPRLGQHLFGQPHVGIQPQVACWPQPVCLGADRVR